MEMEEDIVIVGAGISGLATALGFHRLGLRSLVLESSNKLRITGFALTTWLNAWKALDALGIGDSLRQQHVQLQGLDAASTVSGLPTTQISFIAKGKHGTHEVRCTRRKELLETLEKELPLGTIRFSSKVVSIEEVGYRKLVHLGDGSIYKTKVLIGCDGVNSVVAKWLGLQMPVFTGRYATRGYIELPDGHGFGPKFLQFLGDGFRSGLLPCNDKSLYWFVTWTRTNELVDKDIEENPIKMKQFVMSKLGKVPKEVMGAIENTNFHNITSSPLRFRRPWNILWGDIHKGNVCVAGDALHPMTPDIGQGGCSALEDGVVLARCLGEALLRKPSGRRKEKVKEAEEEEEEEEEEEYNRIKEGLKKYVKERRWRSFELISTAYLIGVIQQSNGKMMNFVRDKLLSTFMAGMFLKMADFDCGKLITS